MSSGTDLGCSVLFGEMKYHSNMGCIMLQEEISDVSSNSVCPLSVLHLYSDKRLYHSTRITHEQVFSNIQHSDNLILNKYCLRHLSTIEFALYFVMLRVKLNFLRDRLDSLDRKEWRVLLMTETHK
jgi:hypothetical protein